MDHIAATRVTLQIVRGRGGGTGLRRGEGDSLKWCTDGSGVTFLKVAVVTDDLVARAQQKVRTLQETNIQASYRDKR